MEKKKMVFAETDRMSDLEDEAMEFFEKVLDMDYGECFVSDESALSDFVGCGVDSEGMPPFEFGGREYAGAWFSRVSTRVFEIYGFKPKDIGDLIADLLSECRKARGESDRGG